MGDGDFKWWVGRGVEPESFGGPYDSREEVIEIGRDEMGDFTICEADKSVPSFKVFSADSVIENYQDHNEDCWGEDGPDITTTSEQDRELEEALATVFQAWMEKHDLVNTWAFGTMRNLEYFPEELPPPPQAAE